MFIKEKNMYKKIIARINLAALATSVVAFSVYALSSDDAVCRVCADIGCWSAFVCLLTFGMYIAAALKNSGSHSYWNRFYNSSGDDGDGGD